VSWASRLAIAALAVRPRGILQPFQVSVRSMPDRLPLHASTQWTTFKYNFNVPRTYASTPLAERLWRRVDKSDECWLWTGGLRNGYGVIGTRSYGPIAYTHRVAWELTYGPVPNGLFVCHKCDVRNCVRPDHLFLGTNADNQADKIAKGRARWGVHIGAEHPRAKLTDADVVAIRMRYAKGGVLQTELAAEYGVTPPMIGYIVRGTAWRHLL
jgi:HNH endonuclease